MTLEEHKKEAKLLLDRAKRYGDWFAVTEYESLLSDLEKLTESEYSSYVKLKKMLQANTVKPIIEVNKNGTE